MEHLEFFKLLSSYSLIEPINEYLLSLLDNELTDKSNKEEILKFFCIYFALIDDGNACVSLDKDILSKKWNKKVDGKEVLFKDEDNNSDISFKNIRDISEQILDKTLSEINETNLPKLIGKNRYFYIDKDNYLYIKKYYDAKENIVSSIHRIFKSPTTNFKRSENLDVATLTKGQLEAIDKGVNRNLVITGGPGTGKTTSVLFLLLSLLENNLNQFIYLIAPSGKASGRIKESIQNSFAKLVDKSKVDPQIIKKIDEVEESTIHRLLHINHSTGAFTRNHNYQFADNSIFIIDEASMIDICLFASLLDAIPDKARVFILGDYNQLPSVEAGAVFANLVDMDYLKNDYVVRLIDFVRFSKDSEVFKVAAEINGNTPISEKYWQNPDDFQIIDLPKGSEDKPVYFYKNDGIKQKDIISSIIKKWADKYYSDLQEKCTDIDSDNQLNEVYKAVSNASILCAVNEGIYGTKAINSYIRKNYIDKSKKTSIDGYYPGELIIINKNNKQLGLYNGNTGILVTFKGDNTIYFMFKKTSKDVAISGKKVDDIFSLQVGEDKYMFYPLRMISETDFDLAYAITIHKSQGSEYDNILIILPNVEGHPLLTRQIVYTAITRSKGSAYILSNQDRLIEAQMNFETRDTNIK